MKHDSFKSSNISPSKLIRSISTGYWSSRALSSAIEIGLFSAINNKEWCLEDLAKELNVSERGLEVLLRFLQSVGLIVGFAENSVTASAVTRTFLDPSKDLYLGFEATVSPDVWQAFETLTEKVIHGQGTIDANDYFASLSDLQSEGFFETMRMQGQASAKALAAKIDMQDCNIMVDVGCGAGNYSMELLSQNPGLNVILIDLPDIIERTRAKMIEAHLEERVCFIEGSFWEVLPQAEYDCLLFSRIFHDWSDRQCTALLKRFVDPLKKNGTIIIHEEIIHDVENPEWWPVMVDLFLFCLLGSGRTRTVHELECILHKVGCSTKEVHILDEFTSVLIASKTTAC